MSNFKLSGLWKFTAAPVPAPLHTTDVPSDLDQVLVELPLPILAEETVTRPPPDVFVRERFIEEETETTADLPSAETAQDFVTVLRSSSLSAILNPKLVLEKLWSAAAATASPWEELTIPLVS
jgi:hypothetical protein